MPKGKSVNENGMEELERIPERYEEKSENKKVMKNGTQPLSHADRVGGFVGLHGLSPHYMFGSLTSMPVLVNFIFVLELFPKSITNRYYLSTL